MIARGREIWIIFSLVPLWKGKYPSYTPADIILKYILRWDICLFDTYNSLVAMVTGNSGHVATGTLYHSLKIKGFYGNKVATTQGYDIFRKFMNIQASLCVVIMR